MSMYQLAAWQWYMMQKVNVQSAYRICLLFRTELITLERHLLQLDLTVCSVVIDVSVEMM